MHQRRSRPAQLRAVGQQHGSRVDSRRADVRRHQFVTRHCDTSSLSWRRDDKSISPSPGIEARPAKPWCSKRNCYENCRLADLNSQATAGAGQSRGRSAKEPSYCDGRARVSMPRRSVGPRYIRIPRHQYNTRRQQRSGGCGGYDVMFAS